MAFWQLKKKISNHSENQTTIAMMPIVFEGWWHDDNVVTRLLLALSPASEASKEVANLTWRKNLHTPLYGVKEFVCLSVTNFDLNYLRTGKIEWAEIFLTKNLPNLVLFAGGMKFATQISPLLNFKDATPL